METGEEPVKSLRDRSRLACPFCKRSASLQYPMGFRWRKLPVTCSACGGQSAAVHADSWAVPLLVGLHALVILPLLLSSGIHRWWALALALGFVLLSALVDHFLAYRLAPTRSSPYPNLAVDGDAWTCAACGSGGPDYLAACWDCEEERPAA